MIQGQTSEPLEPKRTGFPRASDYFLLLGDKKKNCSHSLPVDVDWVQRDYLIFFSILPLWIRIGDNHIAIKEIKTV